MLNGKSLIVLSGNIGAGKTTFLNKFKCKLQQDYPEIYQKCVFIGEPTDIFLNIKNPDGESYFDLMYKGVYGSHFKFQLVALSSRIMSIFNSINLNDDCKFFFLERSIDDDMYVFSKMMNKQGVIGNEEFDLLKFVAGPWNKILKPNITKNIFIKCSIDKCLERIKKRIQNNTRPVESIIDTGYLTRIQTEYDELIQEQSYTVVDLGEVGSNQYENGIENFIQIIYKLFCNLN